MWPFKKKKDKPSLVHIEKPIGLLEFGIITEKYTEGNNNQKFRVVIHIFGENGVSREQIESLLNYCFEVYFSKLLKPLPKLVAVSVFAYENEQTKIASIIGTDLNPQIKFQNLDYLNEKPSVKHNLSLNMRQEIFKEHHRQCMKALNETNAVYNSYLQPTDKGELLAFNKKQTKYNNDLEKKYLNELAIDKEIGLDVLKDIFLEGTTFGWPKP